MENFVVFVESDWVTEFYNTPATNELYDKLSNNPIRSLDRLGGFVCHILLLVQVLHYPLTKLLTFLGLDLDFFLDSLFLNLTLHPNYLEMVDIFSVSEKL